MRTRVAASRYRAVPVSVALVVLGLCAPAFAATPTTKPASRGATKKGGLWQPNSVEPAQVVAPFDWTRPAPAGSTAVASFEAAVARAAPKNGLFTLLIVGSDARPKERPDRTRADAIHLLVWNPARNAGTLVGFPRDLWVTSGVPKAGRINAALSGGGPTRLLAAVNGVLGSGGPRVSSYVLTGFVGFEAMVNEIGGVHVRIDQTMNEPLSGAQFSPGWFAMNGGASLAFVRNRKSGVVGGDVGRSANQEKFLLWSLGKLRRETSSTEELARWVATFRKHGTTNLAVGEMLVLAQLARGMDHTRITSVILPTKPVTRSGAAVLDLDNAKASAILRDIAADGVIGS